MPSKRWILILAPALLLAHATVGLSAAPSDPVQTTVTVKPVRPYQPGDKVWYSAPPVPSNREGIESTCERVPATGYIGQGVFASSGSYYSTSWSWSSGSSGQAFTWYVKLPSEATADWGASGGGGGNTSLSANTYHWKVQNNGGTPQAWTVCFS